jgi:antitoxin (DNA-binding transcriptional repressor) of toxin-antitoxin stability system
LVKGGTDVTITLRGKPAAKLIPIQESQAQGDDDFFIGFGIWKDRDEMSDATAYVEGTRKGRSI